MYLNDLLVLGDSEEATRRDTMMVINRLSIFLGSSHQLGRAHRSPAIYMGASSLLCEMQSFGTLPLSQERDHTVYRAPVGADGSCPPCGSPVSAPFSVDYSGGCPEVGSPCNKSSGCSPYRLCVARPGILGKPP